MTKYNKNFNKQQKKNPEFFPQIQLLVNSFHHLWGGMTEEYIPMVFKVFLTMPCDINCDIVTTCDTCHTWLDKHPTDLE